MLNYYEVDSRFAVFGVKSLEEYLAKFLIEGYFHHNVPQDVKDAFVTVSYLTAHAYYYYPLYDEAFNKALRVLEIAVKHKAEQLGVSLKTNKDKNKNLDTLIKEICNYKVFSHLSFTLNRARNIRNSQMHPHNHTFMGVTGRLSSNLMLLVNTINQLFQPDVWHTQHNSIKAAVASKINQLAGKPLFIAKGRPLINKIIDFEVYENRVLFLLEPILLNLSEVVKNHKVVESIQLQVYNFTITNDGFEGVDEENKPVLLTQTIQPSNIQTFEAYQKEISGFTNEEQLIYEMAISYDWLAVEWEYGIYKRNYPLS